MGKLRRITLIDVGPAGDAAGFGLAEFLVSTLIVLALSASIFTLLADLQSNAGYQTEVQSVQANARIAMETIEHYILQAGGNPRNAAFDAVTIGSATQVSLRSDITGSAGGSQGDPDGDIGDADEDVTVRYDAGARSIELVLPDGTANTLANYISNFSLQYLDAAGAVTAVNANVRVIRVTISGASTLANPRTHKTFGITISSDIKLQNRM